MIYISTKGIVRFSATHSLLEEYPLTFADGVVYIVAVEKTIATLGHETLNTTDQKDEFDNPDTVGTFTVREHF